MPPTTRPLIRVMIVDDHNVVRRGIAAVLASEPDIEVVAEARDGQEAIEQFRRHRPDVTLMDLRLPVVSGIEAISRLRHEFAESRFVALTTFDGPEEVNATLGAGAIGFLRKDAAEGELIAAVRDAHAGHLHVQPELRPRRSDGQQGAASTLTERETLVLRLIAEGRANKEIADVLSIAEATVKVHVGHVLQKLGVSSRTQAALCAFERGLFKRP